MPEYTEISLALGILAVIFVYYMAMLIQAGKYNNVGEWFVDISFALVSASLIFYTIIKLNETNTAMIIKAIG